MVAELTQRVEAFEAQHGTPPHVGLREVPQRSATYPFTTRDESHRPAPTPTAPDFAQPLRRGEKVPR